MENTSEMETSTSLYIIVAITIILIALLIISIVIINRTKEKGCGEVVVVKQDTNVTCQIYDYRLDQSLPGGVDAGKSMSCTNLYLFIANDNSVSIYKKLETDALSFTLVQTLTLDGGDAIVSASTDASTGYTYLSIGTIANNHLYLYTNPPGTNDWNEIDIPLLIAPVYLSQWKDQTALVTDDGVATTYSNGILSVTFPQESVQSIGISGKGSWMHLVMGVEGAAYIFTKLISQVEWGESKKSYDGNNDKFGSEVHASENLFTIADYYAYEGDPVEVTCTEGCSAITTTGYEGGQCRIFVYNVEDLENPATLIVLNPNKSEEYTHNIQGDNVVVNSHTTVEMYTKTIIEMECVKKQPWCQTALWNVVNTLDVDTISCGTNDYTVIRTSSGATESVVNMYKRIGTKLEQRCIG